MKRWGALLAGATLLMTGWAFFGPARLGGPVSYVIIHGDSMEPGMRAGDLVLTRESGDYGVGDVVAYHNADMRRVVMHRIIAVEGDRFRLQGDNNNFVDSFRPTSADILGTASLRVPGAGSLLEGLREPRNAGVLVGAAAFLAFGGTAAGRRRKRSQGGAVLPAAAPLRARAWTPARTATVGALVLAVVSAGVLFTRPPDHTTFVAAQYDQVGRFTYSAPAPAGAVYPDGQVDSGEPVFLELVDGLDVEFVYSVDSEHPLTVAGTTELHAVIANDTGWSRRLDLQPITPFNGTHTVVAGRIDLAAVRALLAQVQDETKVARPNFTLDVIPEVTTEGRLADQAFAEAFAPKLEFLLDGQLLQPRPADTSAAGPPVDPMHPRAAASVDVATSVPASVGPATVTTARTLSLVAAGLAMVALMAVGRRPRHDRTEAQQIQARHDRWLVPVADATAGTAVVDVASFDGLVRLAEQHEQLVLHEARADHDVYAVRVGEVAYRYVVGTPPHPEVSAAVPDDIDVATDELASPWLVGSPGV